MARKKSYKVDFGGGRVLALPYRLLISDAFNNLSPKAVVVLIKLARNYNGKNNGDLACTVAMLATGRGMDDKTLRSALEELIGAGLIVKTREHGPFARDGKHQPALYAITWASIDDCPGKSLEIAPGPPRFKFI
ncbi:hypothetical protein [Pseudomonas prosekii]|uniref:hypothetical protein n=1 Tax=Pseudomonas prosekii TaxID=1148509 RepID=UPI003F74FBFE